MTHQGSRLCSRAGAGSGLSYSVSTPPISQTPGLSLAVSASVTGRSGGWAGMAGGPRPASGDGHGPAAPGKAGLPVMRYSCPPLPLMAVFGWRSLTTNPKFHSDSYILSPSFSTRDTVCSSSAHRTGYAEGQITTTYDLHQSRRGPRPGHPACRLPSCTAQTAPCQSITEARL